MTRNPKISVVVCIYNGVRTLQKAILSILDQDYLEDRYEIVLVNDGSSDGSEKICRNIIETDRENCPKITYVFQENAGLGGARNTGIALSKGDIVAFIDQDAIADKKWLCEIENAFGDDQTIGAVGGKIELLNRDSWFATFSHWFHYYTEDRDGNEIIPLVGTNMAFRKEVFEIVGGFFHNFRSFGDETSFTKIKVLPFFKQNTTEDAIVYHERPWTFHQWMKERFFNGHEYALERHISQRSILKESLYFLYRINSLLIPIFLLMAFAIDFILITTGMIMVLSFFVYRCFVRDSLFMRVKILFRNYGWPIAIGLTPFYVGNVMVGKIYEDYGFLKGFFKYFGVQAKDIISGDNIDYLLENNLNLKKKSEKKYER